MRANTAESAAFKRKSAFAWVWELAPRERRAFGACVGGWALDAMDVQMYSFVIPALIVSWGITRADAGVLGTAALLASALGGWLAGWVADRFGRATSNCSSPVGFSGLVSAVSGPREPFSWANPSAPNIGGKRWV